MSHLEPQSNFLVCALNRVRSMDDVATNLNAKVTANCSWSRVSGICCSQHNTASLHNVKTFPDHRNDRTGAHVRNESWEEWTCAQVSVVLLQQLLRSLNSITLKVKCRSKMKLSGYGTHPHKLHCNKLETFSFEALDNVSDKSTLDAIGFNHQKTAFSVRHVRCFYCKTEKENQNVQFSAAENSFKKLKRHLIER